jgi:acetyl esterase/lipase
MKILALVAALLIALVLSSCARLVFAVANAPARFGDFTRQADVAYGEHPRSRLDVYRPKPAAKDSGTASVLPIVVFWYGGAWQAGERAQYRFVGAALAKAGMIAVLPDYRLYPQVRFPSFVDDGTAALAWVVSHARELGGDPARVYVAGHSAGAHLAAMLAYDVERTTRAGLAPGVVRGFIGLSGPYALDPDEPVYHEIFRAPHGHADWQPTRLARAGAPPALLLHGEADSVVSARHAEALRAALEAARVPVRLVTYPGRGHRDTVAAFAAPARNKLPVLDEITRFIASAAPTH